VREVFIREKILGNLPGSYFFKQKVIGVQPGDFFNFDNLDKEQAPLHEKHSDGEIRKLSDDPVALLEEESIRNVLSPFAERPRLKSQMVGVCEEEQSLRTLSSARNPPSSREPSSQVKGRQDSPNTHNLIRLLQNKDNFDQRKPLLLSLW